MSRRVALSTAFLGGALYAVAIANSIADRINPNSHLPFGERVVLPDPIMELMSSFVGGNWTWVPELLAMSSIILWFIRLLLTRNVELALTIIKRTFTISAVIYTCRAVSVVMTLLPYPLVKCEVNIGNSVWMDALDLMVQRKMSCGDVWFSGHTVLYVIVMSTYITYRVNYIWTTVVIVNCVLGMGSLLCVRYHYTIDVVSAAFVSGVFWFGYHYTIAMNTMQRRLITELSTIRIDNEPEITGNKLVKIIAFIDADLNA